MKPKIVDTRATIIFTLLTFISLKQTTQQTTKPYIQMLRLKCSEPSGLCLGDSSDEYWCKILVLHTRTVQTGDFQSPLKHAAVWSVENFPSFM